LRQELAIHQARLALLEEVANGSLIGDSAQAQRVSETVRHFDALYADLEDHFRGSREAVKEACAFYLPYIEALPDPALPVADLGCGRGEWLELLRERGANAIGVDNNRVMVESCREQSLPVVESAVLAYLRDQRDNSLRAVTAFHVIEHLPFEDLIALLDEIMRTLQPGGIAIFETPNPDNLFVASNYFYHDPTHRNPLPSRLAKFLVEARGFARVEIINLHECEAGRFTGSDEVSVRLNELFYGPMDYAIVGWKHDQ
jgi:O-antigen chain-terminating methyltransferase